MLRSRQRPRRRCARKFGPSCAIIRAAGTEVQASGPCRKAIDMREAATFCILATVAFGLGSATVFPEARQLPPPTSQTPAPAQAGRGGAPVQGAEPKSYPPSVSLYDADTLRTLFL